MPVAAADAAAADAAAAAAAVAAAAGAAAHAAVIPDTWPAMQLPNHSLHSRPGWAVI